VLIVISAKNSKTVWASGPERTNVMFGRMMVTAILEVGRDPDLEAAITTLLRAAEPAISWRRLHHHDKSHLNAFYELMCTP
jgi:hypothetical protein